MSPIKERYDYPVSDYNPIDCNYYDYFEAAIVQRRIVQIRYLLPDGQEEELSTKLRDLQTQNHLEFVQLADESWLRLDRILSLDGVINSGLSCQLPD